MTADLTLLACIDCHRTYSNLLPRWRCDCGGRLSFHGPAMFRREDLKDRPLNMWRYREAFGLQPGQDGVTLGEGFTPLTTLPFAHRTALAKLDFLCPTGSYKDRGSSVMLSQLRQWGVGEVVEDSSGNAGASVAAYAGAAGVKANIYVPESASQGKLVQIGLYGANLVRVPGSRERTASEALEAAQRTFYASHNWSPHFLLGLKTSAYEISEQMNWKAPDWVITPAGNGGLAGGLFYGFRDLMSAGIIDRMPRLVLVQAERCAPVYQAWKQGADTITGIEKLDTAAEGISVAKPVRGIEMLEALRVSNGLVHTVSEVAIWNAFERLASLGIYVEPTSATAAAAAETLIMDGTIAAAESVVVYLTGNGLKATESISRRFASRFMDESVATSRA